MRGERSHLSNSRKTDRHHDETHRHPSNKYTQRDSYDTKVQSKDDTNPRGKDRHHSRTHRHSSDREMNSHSRNSKTYRHFGDEERHSNGIERDMEYEKNKDSRSSEKRRR